MALVEDNSLMYRLEQGKFGEFRRAIDRLDFDWSAFALPRIVVVGVESAGKSSLMENITKCTVFPRDRDVCTKMPVCLEMRTNSTAVMELEHNGRKYPLQSQAEIRGVVKRAFDMMGDTIQNDEVIVRITNPLVPTLTLVDLPGLRTYPPELAERTMGMAGRYLSLPHTLVICVVQATDRLTGNKAVALTMAKLGQQMRTRAILVLSKPDLVSDLEWEEKVAARLRGTSRELQGVSFARCVSVMSRRQEPDGAELLSLAEADAAEKDWWPRKLPEAALQAQVGAQQLIAIVDDVFSSYIQSTWKYRALEMLQGKRRAVADRLEALGPDPATLTPQQVHADVCSRLHRIGNAWPFAFLSQPLDVRPVTRTGCNWDWVVDFARLTKEVQEWAQRLLAAPQLLQDVQGVIAQAFADGVELGTKRFADLQRALVQVAGAEFEARKPYASRRVDRLIEDGLDQLRRQESQTAENIRALERSVLRAVNEFVCFAISAIATADPSSFSLEESAEVRALRNELTCDLGRIQLAMLTIQDL